MTDLSVLLSLLDLQRIDNLSKATAVSVGTLEFHCQATGIVTVSCSAISFASWLWPGPSLILFTPQIHTSYYYTYPPLPIVYMLWQGGYAVTSIIILSAVEFSYPRRERARVCHGAWMWVVFTARWRRQKPPFALPVIRKVHSVRRCSETVLCWIQIWQRPVMGSKGSHWVVVHKARQVFSCAFLTIALSSLAETGVKGKESGVFPSFSHSQQPPRSRLPSCVQLSHERSALRWRRRDRGGSSYQATAFRLF